MHITPFSSPLAIISGAAQGIGAAVAQTLAKLGYQLVLLDRDSTALHASLGELPRLSGQAHLALSCDVADSAAVNAAVAQAEQLGPVELLVNVAGILRMGTVLGYTDADWDATFAVNVGGVFKLSRAVAGPMQARRRGCIISVTSNAATIPRQQMAAYAASKAASNQFMRCLGLELAEFGIRCNTVSPGSTDTAMQRQFWRDGVGQENVIRGSLDGFRLGIPLARIASAQDIAQAVSFLASPAAAHITMHDLRVDGGAGLGG